MTNKVLAQHRSAISLGWVRWFGHPGQLVLAPLYPGGGEVGGHLIFRFKSAGEDYAITLHSWVARFRVIGRHFSREVTLHRGPALPRIVATLKSILGSSLRGR